MNSICVDGKIVPAGAPVLEVDNTAYRYGDGLFETLKMIRGNILFSNWHFERFFFRHAVAGVQDPGTAYPAKINTGYSIAL